MQVNKLTDGIDISSHERFLAARKSTWVSVLVNCFLTSGQVITGVFSGSQGLIADGIHSLSDLVSDFVVLIANHKSKKNPDDDHHYGHHRYENGASLILGTILFIVGIGMLWSAANKMQQPDDIPQVHIVALWVALAALVIKELLFRYMLAVATRVKSTMLVANAWHARSDAASSLVVAIGIIGSLSGFKLLDPVAALVVGLIVTRMGYSFMSDSLHDLMDRAVDIETENSIKTTLLSTPGVEGIHDLKTRKMGDLVVVDVHLEIDGDLSVKVGHDIAVLARKSVLDNHHVLNVMRTVVIGATLLLSPCVMAGSDGVEHAMKMMNKSYRAALKEEDVTSFRKDMRELKATAESILNSPVEGYDRETYVAGMSLLIDEVTAVESTAEKEGLDAGKIAAQKLGSLMRKYHNKLGVD